MKFFGFCISDWLDLITGIAIILGVIGASWKWFFEEALRRRREVPSIDGTVSFAFTPKDNNNSYLAIRFIWNNRSQEPVYLHPEKAAVHLFDLDKVSSDTINPYSLIQKGIFPVLTMHPLKGLSYYMLEPGTSSEIEAYTALVRAKKSYLMYSIFPIDARQHKSKSEQNWSWSRTRILAS